MLHVIASESHGFVSTTALLAHGCSERRIRTMVKHGWLVRVRRGTYAVGYVGAGEEAQWAGAVHRAGFGASLDAWSSAHAWRFAPAMKGPTQVVVPTRRRAVPGVSLRTERRLDASWTATIRGVTVLTPTRTISRIAVVSRPERVVGAMREAAFQGLLDLDSLIDIVDTEAGSMGIRNLRDAIALRLTGSKGARSAFELRVLDHLAARCATQPRYNVDLLPRCEVDLAWDALGICCEIDGPTHDAPDQRRKDDERDRALRARGWRVFRLHWSDFDRDPDAACRPVLEAIAREVRSRR